MDKKDNKRSTSRRGSEVPTRDTSSPKYEATTDSGDAEIARVKQQLEIERLKTELARLKTAGTHDKTSKPRQDRRRNSSGSSSGSSYSSSSCSSNGLSSRPSDPIPSGPLDPFGRPFGSGWGMMPKRTFMGKTEGDKWRITDITAGGVSCNEGVVPFTDFIGSASSSVLQQYRPIGDIRKSKRLEAEPENTRRREEFKKTYTHIVFKGNFCKPELIREDPPRKHRHSHRHGHRRGSGTEKTVHILPINDPFNHFFGTRPGGF